MSSRIAQNSQHQGRQRKTKLSSVGVGSSDTSIHPSIQLSIFPAIHLPNQPSSLPSSFSYNQPFSLRCTHQISRHLSIQPAIHFTSYPFNLPSSRPAIYQYINPISHLKSSYPSNYSFIRPSNQSLIQSSF